MRKSRRTRRISKKSGFTLTEVLVASTLLIVAMVPILKGLTAAHVTSKMVERKTMSLALANAKLDEIKAGSIYSYESSFAENNTDVGDGYLCDVTDSSLGSDLREVIVSVGHDTDGDNSLDSEEVEVTLSTYLARRV